VYSTVMALSEVSPVVIVPGNHDNDRRLSALAPLFRLANVHVRAGVDREPLELTAGKERVRIASIPWLSQRFIVKAAQMMDSSAAETRGIYEERMQLIVDALTESFDDSAVNLILGHVTIAGGLKGGGEREAQTIFDYHVTPTIYPATAHYVALGHLHKMQSMPGRAPIHYSGSPLQLDFGEGGNEPHMMLVEAKPKVPVKVTPVPVAGGRSLMTLRGTLEELRAQASNVGDAYLRVFVRERERVGLGDDVRGLLPNTVKVIVEHEEGRKDRRERVETTGLSARELFGMYLEEREVDDKRLLALFDELHEGVQEGAA
jgi:DNA repair protein SbcD/Mre11